MGLRYIIVQHTITAFLITIQLHCRRGEDRKKAPDLLSVCAARVGVLEPAVSPTKLDN